MNVEHVFLKGFLISIMGIVCEEVSAIEAPPPKIIIGVSTSYAPPYAHIENDMIKGGFIKQVGDALAKEMGVPVEYTLLPVLRVYDFLFSNEINMICFESESWNPEYVSKVNWSPALFHEQEVIITKPTQKLENLEQLIGVMGTINGYEYPNIQSLFDEKKLTRENVISLKSNFEKMKTNRIDFILDESIPVHTIMKSAYSDFKIFDGNAPDQKFLSKYLNHYDLKCNYNDSLNAKAVNTAFQRLIDAGIINTIFNLAQ